MENVKAFKTYQTYFSLVIKSRLVEKKWFGRHDVRVVTFPFCVSFLTSASVLLQTFAFDHILHLGIFGILHVNSVSVFNTRPTNYIYKKIKIWKEEISYRGKTLVYG